MSAFCINFPDDQKQVIRPYSIIWELTALKVCVSGTTTAKRNGSIATASLSLLPTLLSFLTFHLTED